MVRHHRCSVCGTSFYCNEECKNPRRLRKKQNCYCGKCAYHLIKNYIEDGELNLICESRFGMLAIKFKGSVDKEKVIFT